MWWLLFFLCFTATGWSDEEDDDDYEDNEDEECWVYPCEIAYGGLSFTCDFGCGDPEKDGQASDIYFLLSAWLWHPIASQEYAATNKKYAQSEFGLTYWKKSPYELSDLSDLYEECKSWCGQDLGVCLDNATHGEFCYVMAMVRSELTDEIARSRKRVGSSIRAIQRMEELAAKKPRIHIRFYDEEEGLFKIDPYDTPIGTALRVERESLAYHQSALAAKQAYSLYAEAVFSKVDELYKKMFLWCLENHQAEGIAFHAALSQFLAQDYEDALAHLRALLDLSAENGFDNAILSRLHVLCGQLQSEALLYGEAILSLTEALKKDPSCKEAYFERAAVYFEIGDFEASIRDFLLSDKKEEAIAPSDIDLSAFAVGMTQGAAKGVGEAIADFLPNLWSSLSGVGNFLWTTISNPIEAPKEYATTVCQIFYDLSRLDGEELAQLVAPEVCRLIKNWGEMTSNQQGRAAGYILAKYGTDLTLAKRLFKGLDYGMDHLNHYAKIKEMEKFCALKTLTSSPTQKKALTAAAISWQERRAAYFAKVELEVDKQGKHIRGHKNFGETKSEWTNSNPEKKLKELAGKGQKITGAAGEAGYKERVDCGELIGFYCAKGDQGPGVPTTMATIHYSKKGAHIVPARPKE